MQVHIVEQLVNRPKPAAILMEYACEHAWSGWLREAACMLWTFNHPDAGLLAGS